MRIIEMLRKTDNGKPMEYNENDCDPHDFWCVIETKEEEMLYDDFVEHLGEYSGDCRDILWNKLVIHAGQGQGVNWGDDDMYGYLRPDEDVPEVGEEMTDNEGDIWLRTY